VQSLEGEIEEGAWEKAVDLRDVESVEDGFESRPFPETEEDFHYILRTGFFRS
jgi:hypothetical protein